MNRNKLMGKIIADGYTQGEFAKMLHINRSTLSKKMNGKSSFTLEEAFRVCEILGVTSGEEMSSIFLPITSRNRDKACVVPQNTTTEAIGE